METWKHGNKLSMVAKIQNNPVIDCGANLTKELSLIGLSRVQPRLGEAKLSSNATVIAAHGFGVVQQIIACQSSHYDTHHNKNSKVDPLIRQQISHSTGE